MRRMITHLLMATTVMGDHLGKITNIVPYAVPRPEQNPAGNLISRQFKILSNTLMTLDWPNALNGLVKPYNVQVPALPTSVNALGLPNVVGTSGITLGGVVGGVGGLLNATANNINQILTPTLQPFLTVCTPSTRKSLLTFVVGSSVSFETSCQRYSAPSCIGSPLPWLAVLGMLQFSQFHRSIWPRSRKLHDC